MNLLPVGPRREAARRPYVQPSNLFSDYVLHHEIASGPHATIFSAHYAPNEETRRLVQLKRLSTRDPEISAQFHREMQLVARVQHPCVARLFRNGTWGGTPYAVYQAERGASLALCVRFQRGSALSPAAILEIAANMAQALACAHRSAVTHGPFDPAQITITRHGRLLLGGFAPGSLQCRSNDVEPNEFLLRKAAGTGTSADIFWLGILLLRLVSPLAPKAHAPEVPREMLEMVHAMLSFQSEARPAADQIAKTLVAQRDLAVDPRAARDELAQLVVEAEVRSDSHTQIARVITRR